MSLDLIWFVLGAARNILVESTRIVSDFKPDICIGVLGDARTPQKGILRAIPAACGCTGGSGGSRVAARRHSAGNSTVPPGGSRSGFARDAGVAVAPYEQSTEERFGPVLIYLLLGKGSVLSEPSRCLMSICTLPSAASSSFLQAADSPTPSSKSLSDSSRLRSPFSN